MSAETTPTPDRYPLRRIRTRLGAVLAALGGAVSGLATIGAITAEQDSAVQGVLTGTSALGTAIAVLLAAFGVASRGEPLVTPIADPRDDTGHRLVQES